MVCAIWALIPATLWRSSRLARDTAFAEPKYFEQRTFACGSDAGDLVERINAQGLAALGAMRAKRKPVRFVAQTLNE